MPLQDNTIVSEETVRGRFDNFGGIPRVVFGGEAQVDAFTANQTRQIRQLENVSDVLQGLRPEDVHAEHNIPTHLFAYKSDHLFTARGLSIEELSIGARKAIFKNHYNLMMKLVAGPEQPKVTGFQFEDFVGWLLAAGAEAFGLRLDSPVGLLCQRWDGKTWVPAPQFILPQQPERRCDNPEIFFEAWRSWKDTDQSGVLRAPDGFTGIDYLLSATRGVQVTVSTEHLEPPPTFYSKYLEGLRMDHSDFDVLYFVPGMVFGKFRVKKRTGKEMEGVPRANVFKVSVPMSTSSLP